MADEKVVCDKCGHEMSAVSDWCLDGLTIIEYICPNCTHVERREYIVAERARREER
jgi:hypothetical protein